MSVFKLIKTTKWESSTKEKGETLVIAYQGRVFNVNKGDFEGIVVDDKSKTVTLGEVPVVTQESYVDAMGATKIGLRLKPKCTLEFSTF